MISSLPFRSPRRRLSFETLEVRLAPAAGLNPIVAENQLLGTPQSVWDVGSGDPSVQGFATDISVNRGQTVYFKINDPQLVAYHIDIYRIGYYQGMGARQVATISSSQTLRYSQPSPLSDPATGLVDAGNWAVSASWAVPATAVSGVYIANIIRDDTGSGSQMIFIVRDDAGTSDILFQTSDSTWQAYNTWGGNSLYSGSPAGRAYKVSYNRPINTRSAIAPRDYFFGEEYAMVRWLEGNGYNVSYFTDMDSDRYGTLIKNHDVFLSVGHDEYWSGGQRANVTSARDAGVNLAFFSGNEAYWKTRWENSIDGSGTSYRTLVCYKESLANAKIDPNPAWTGLWRDPRFSPPADGVRPENNLTGTIFTVNRGPGGETGTSFTVPSTFANMRFWRNTSVAALQPGQTATLGDQVLGYEWDEDLDNGFRPAGLINLSSTTQTVPQKLFDYGSTVGTGTATHSLTLYRAASGALVFGAGTVQWAWGLDGTHDGPQTTPDPAMRQATVNLLADMGVQPDTLQAGITTATRSTDAVAPTSTITSPVGGATLTVGTAVTITGTATESGGGVLAAVEVSVDGGQTWRRATGTTNWSYTWTPGQVGPVTIKTRAVDDSLNVEAAGAGVATTVQAVATSTTGLVVAFGFNEGSGGTISNSSSTSLSTTFSGATSPTWTTGMYGTGILFDGVDDRVNVADATALHLTTGMTLEAWVRPTALTDFSTVVMKERGTTGIAYNLYASDGNLQPPSTYITDTNAGRATGTSVLTLNTWSHLASTYDGTTLTLYVNGQPVGTQTLANGLTSSISPLRIGGNAIWGEYFKGVIDEVRIYNRPLSQGEVQIDMSTPIGGSIENTAPTATVAQPTGTVSGVTNVTVTATDNVGVTGVQLLVDGQSYGTEDTVAPYVIAWNTTGYANGDHTLSAQVRDAAGNVSTTAGVVYTVANASDTTPPTVSITYPSASLRLSGTVVVDAVAGDNIGVVGVKLQLDGVNVATEDTAAPYAIAWNTAGSPDGTHNLTAVARDAAGNVTVSAPVTVVIDNTGPTVTAHTPAAGATGVDSKSDIKVTFSESINASTVVVTLKDPANNVAPVSVAYDDTTRILTVHPVHNLELGATYTVAVSGVQDLAGNPIASPATWTFTTSSQLVNATLWTDSTTPTTASANDPSSIEVGVKFQSELSGYITGLRFYKGTSNTGTHVGHLWDGAGNLVATATFANETASGWQSVTLGAPVAITPNTTYVASYYAPNGGYAADANYFASAGWDSGFLHALPNSSGGNGVYRYVTGGGYPTSSFAASNYWVDVLFSNVLADVTAPTVTAQSPAANATGVSTTIAPSATFSESVQGNTISFVLRDAGNNVVPASVSYNTATRTVTLTPNAALAQSTTYTATLSAAQDAAGNVMQLITWSFATIGSDLTPPTLIAKSPAPGATAIAPSSVVAIQFSESIQLPTLTFVLKDPNGREVSSLLEYDDVTHTAELSPGGADDGGVPLESLAPSTTYTVTVSGAKDQAGNMMQAVSWSFTTDAAIINNSLWTDTTAPAVASVNDLTAIEVGMKFQSAKDGYITGLQFYKGASNTGAHVGHLWDAHGNLLATATFANETASGWQTVTLSSPVFVAAGTTYVASYYAPNGGYAANGAYFISAVTSGSLTALASGASGGNGLYRYGAGGGFPTDTFNSTNYWVDVVFSNSVSDLTPPSVVTTNPAAGATNVGVNAAPTVTFSESVQPASISIVLKDSANNTVPATVTYDDATHVATVTPNSLMANVTNYTVTVIAATDAVGNVMTSPVSFSFTTGNSMTNASIWGTAVVPAVSTAADTSPVELGLAFKSDTAGYITAIRFYKGTGNTGTHVGHLWDANGILLGTVTFTSETASGWQSATLTLPVQIAANNTYLVSYYAPNGGYSYDHGYFDGTGVANSPLYALANGDNGGNGRYRYGVGGGFPANSYASTNYWVDVVFNNVLGDTTAPTVATKAPAAGAIGVAPSAPITVTFSESVQSTTPTIVVKDANNNLVNGTLTYDQSTMTATFQPAANLLARQAYTVTVSGAKDPAGNTMTPVTWSFTTKGTWSQSSVSDFSTGIGDGVVVTGQNGGALQLGATFDEQFAGTSLATSWATSSWTSQGGGATSIAVAGGALSVQGGMVASVATYPGIGVEGRVNFAANPYQHFGLATNLDDVVGRYWAIFSTGGRNDTLYARVNVSGATQEVNLGALPTGFHSYKVVPKATGVEFYLDDVLKTTVNLTFPAGTPMRVVFSSFNGGTALQADWARVVNFRTSGTFTSTTFDAGTSVTWLKPSWTATAPSNTTVQVEIMVSDDPNFTSASWITVSDAQWPTMTGRYIKYRVTLTTTDPLVTPIFEDISLDFV